MVRKRTPLSGFHEEEEGCWHTVMVGHTLVHTTIISDKMK